MLVFLKDSKKFFTPKMIPQIIATVGPTSRERLQELQDAGVSVFRLNFSHGTRLWHQECIEDIRKLKKKSEIMIDTRGPEIRSGTLEEPLALRKGERLTLVTNKSAQKTENRLIYCSYSNIPRAVSIGDTIQFDNGRFAAEVKSVHQSSVVLEVLDDAVLRSARHINLPGIRIDLPTLSKQDIRDLKFAKEVEADFVALSFVREVRDIRDARKLVGDNVKIVAKIECQQGVNCWKSIARESDGIMIARGDLAVETSFEQLPILQRDMLRQLQKIKNTFGIVATGLLRSMTEEKKPHRSEVNDVAIAVWEGTDYLMLSDETAVGKYPIESINVLRKTAEAAAKDEEGKRGATDEI